MMPAYETLSQREQKAIEELQMRMKGCLSPKLREDESVYYRFLKARDFDVDKGEEMLRNHIIFRKVNQIDTILEDFQPIEIFQKLVMPSLVGYDKDGDVVNYSPCGKLNAVDIMKCMTFRSYMKHWFWFAEKRMAVLRTRNQKTRKSGIMGRFIFDIDQLTFANATCKESVNMFLRFVTEYQNNYPEHMKATYIINAPSHFVVLFSILKSVMSSAVLRKMHLFRSNGWNEKLVADIGADVLPAFLGGNRTDPDGNPLCKSFICHGGQIPEYHFLSDKKRFLKGADCLEKVIIPARKKKEMLVEVKDVGSLIQWEFLVKGKDIGFGIFLERSGHKRTEIIPIHKCNTSDGAEKDSYKCRSIGKYIIVFDNTYSWMNAKEIQCYVTVVNCKL